MQLDMISEFAGRGGALLALLALLSVFALALMLLKGWQFYRVRPNAVALEEALAALTIRQPAAAHFRRAGGWAAAIFAPALEAHEKGRGAAPDEAALARLAGEAAGAPVLILAAPQATADDLTFALAVLSATGFTRIATAQEKAQ